jgi:hypothetical protein
VETLVVEAKSVEDKVRMLANSIFTNPLFNFYFNSATLYG